MLSEELKSQIEKEVKFWAKNNMCASCFADMEVFVNMMNNLIHGQDSLDNATSQECWDGVMSTCLDELEFIGLDADNEVYEEVHNLLVSEAKFWLKDYYKHKKDYDPEEIIEEY